MQYRSEIDGLRALAVIPVILFHAGYEMFQGGFVGVDVFFVISGYLITGIIISELATDNFSIARFYERRARRILPALFLVIICCWPAAWYLLPPTAMQDFGKSVASVSLFSSNILFWHESGYFDTSSELKPLLHTWSLAVEEQFYVLFPIFLIFAWRYGWRVIVPSILAIALLSFIVAEVASTRNASLGFFLLPSRIWELSIGAILAIYVGKERFSLRSLFVRECLGALGLLMILVGVFAISSDAPYPSRYTLLPTVGTALVIAFASKHTRVGRLLGWRPLVGVGLISYSAYLWHQPLFVFARHVLWFEPSDIVKAVLCVATIVLAYLTWRYVERPFRNPLAVSRKGVVQFSVVGSAALLSSGLLGAYSGGFLALRTTVEQQRALSSAASSEKRSECHTGGINYRAPRDACQYHVSGGTWAVFGDSHTVELSMAMADALLDHRDGVRHFSMSGCKPSYLLAESVDPCTKWTNEAVEFVATNEEITQVVVSYRIAAALFGDHERQYPLFPNSVSEEMRSATWSSYVHILRRFSEAGKHVILVMQSPELPEPVDRLIFRDDGDHILGARRAWWSRRSAYVIDRLSEIPPNVAIVDPGGIFCDEIYCNAVVGRRALYFDDDHMSVYGASLVATEVLRVARERAWIVRK